MRNLLTLLLLAVLAAAAPAQTISVVPAADSGMVQLRTVYSKATGSQDMQLSDPMTAEQALGNILAQYQSATDEVAAYETRLVEARKRVDTLIAVVQSLNAGVISSINKNAQTALAGTWVLTWPGGSAKLTFDDKGAVSTPGGKDKATVAASGSRSFTLAGFFTKNRGAFGAAKDVVFFQQDGQVWRGKADIEITFIKKK